MLSIVIPTKNEENNIRRTLIRIGEVMNKAGLIYEILIIDDNSADNTVYQAVMMMEYMPIKVFKVGYNDLAQSVFLGMRYAKGNRIVVMDADGQHDADLIPLLLDSELVIVEVWHRNPIRSIISDGGRMLAKLFIPKVRKYTAPTSNFFGIKKSKIKGMKFKERGFKPLLEILTKVEFKEWREIRTELLPRTKDGSKFNLREMFKYLRTIYNLYAYQNSD